MIPFWNYIKNEIEKEFEINSSKGWKYSNREKLKIFESKLEKKIKEKIASESLIAEQFLKSTGINEFTESTDKRASIESLVQTGGMDKPKLDLRTLEKFLVDSVSPTQKRVRNIYSIYIFNLPYSIALDEYRRKHESKRGKKINSTNSKMNHFYETNWFVYYYHYDEFLKDGLLGRASLKVNKEGEVYLQNVKHETSTNFTGKLESEISHQHLSIDLWSEGTKEKHLRVSVYIGVGKVYPLLVGVYTNIYSNNSIAAGTIILERTTNEDLDNNEPRTFKFEEGEDAGINDSIIEYLKSRQHNFLKAPGGILTTPMLERWMTRKKRQNQSNS